MKVRTSPPFGKKKEKKKVHFQKLIFSNLHQCYILGRMKRGLLGYVLFKSRVKDLSKKSK